MNDETIRHRPSLLPSMERWKPRASVDGQSKTNSQSMAGLPRENARALTKPPLFCNGPSLGSVIMRSKCYMPGWKPRDELPLSRLVPVEMNVPSPSREEVPLSATMAFETAVPELYTSPPSSPRGRTKFGAACNHINYTAGRRDKPIGKPPFAQEIFDRFNTRKRLRTYQQTTCPMCASTRPVCCS